MSIVLILEGDCGRVCLSAVGVIVAVLRMPSDEEISFNIRYAVIFATIEVNFSIVTCMDDPPPNPEQD